MLSQTGVIKRVRGKQGKSYVCICLVQIFEYSCVDNWKSYDHMGTYTNTKQTKIFKCLKESK